MQYQRIVMTASLFALFGFGLRLVAADKTETADAVPEEVRKLAGTYTGSWTLYGINDKGEMVKRMAWTDTVKADKPQVKDGRAFVTTVDEMVFEGGKGPPVKMQGKEGYFLQKNGKVGAYFIETFGRVQRVTKLGDNVWSYAVAAAPQELQRLGFPDGAKAEHVLVKVVTSAHGVEMHHISRLTTVSWKDKQGKDRWMQYVSLQGYHKRQP